MKYSLKYIIYSTLLIHIFINIVANTQKKFATISYTTLCGDNSLWGVGNSQAIFNNKGKKGTVSGIASSIGICPCLQYGITPWHPGVSIAYNYTSSEQQQVESQQKSARDAYKTSTPLDTSSQLPTIEMTDIFEHAYEFVDNLDSTIQNLINLFPDVYEGQGYESEAFLKLCTFSTPLIDRINAICTQLFGWAQYEYFIPNEIFTITWDLTSVIPSTTDIAQGNAFARAVINQYIHSLKIEHVSTSLEKNSLHNNETIADKMAIKKALLW